MKNKETLEEAAKKSFGEIWASLTTEQSEYLKGYIDRQIDMAKRRQAERMYSEEDIIGFAEFIAKYPDKNRNHSGQMLHAKSKYDGAERTIDLLQVWFEKFKKK
jgi:uncharacterized protein YfaT (DUF1175 family)